jgi:murein DD-endopeptidase MepM/ murein hydrolase activator NlpD
VIPYQPGVTRIKRWDLSENYTALTPEIFTNLAAFTEFIEQKLQNEAADFGIGGYNELRGIYARSGVFGASDSPEEPRRLHLGLDIWGPAHTPVYAAYEGVIHSQAFHPELGNYGGVIILQHSYQGNPFYTLCGHLTEQSVHQFQPGQFILGGSVVGTFGTPAENGGWPPHLHFQCMLSMEN